MNFYEIDYAGRWVNLGQRPLLGGLFARYDGGGGKVESSQSKLPIQSDAITQALQSFMSQGRIGSGQDSFSGDRTAPFSDIQNQALGGLGGFLDVFNPQNEIPFFGQTGDALQGILSGETGAEQFTPERANEIFTASRQLPAEQTFQRFTKPLIDEGFAGPGFFNEARPREVLREGELLQQGLRGEREAFLGQTEAFNRQLSESRANRALSAIPLGAGLAGLPTQLASQQLAGRGGVFGLGQQQQQQQQHEIQAEREIFSEAQRFMDPEDFQNLIALLGIRFDSSSSVESGGGGFMDTLLPTLATAAGTAFGGPVGGAAAGALGSLLTKPQGQGTV